MQRLLDFDVVIEPLGDGFRTRVVASPAGEAHADFVLPFSDNDLEILVLRVVGSIGRARRKVRRIESQERRLLEAFGGQLFQAAFSGPVRECLGRSRLAADSRGAGLRIRLRLPPALANVPWEFLYDREYGFVGLSPETALVRYLEMPAPARPFPISPPLRILAMISAPSDVPELQGDEEWGKLNDALHDLVSRGMVQVDRLDAGTLSALQRPLRLNEYHVLHFVGHGAFDEDAQDGALALEGAGGRSRLVTGRDLGVMVRGHRSLRLVVLNACEGARSARDDPFGGVAQALVRQGIPAVIAMQFEISDPAALMFSQSFYQAIADGLPVDVAMVEARRAMFAEGNEVEWATPVLYLRSPDGRVFIRGRISGADRKAREDADRKAREDADRKAREDADRKAREDADRKAREDADRKAREDADRKAREDADRKAREDADRKAREDADRKAREDADRKAREDADRKAREDADRKDWEAALDDWRSLVTDDGAEFDHEIREDAELPVLEERARWTGEAGDPAAARDQYAALLPVRERVSGPDHPDTLTTREGLARWTGEAGDPAAARDQYAALLPVRERVSGPDHPDTLNTRHNLAYWTGEAGDPVALRDWPSPAGSLPEALSSGPPQPDEHPDDWPRQSELSPPATRAWTSRFVARLDAASRAMELSTQELNRHVTRRDRKRLGPFHTAILDYLKYRDGPDAVEAIREMLPNATFLGLGSTAKAGGTEVNLIHFTTDEGEYLPLWSDPDALNLASKMNPDWASLTTLILQGLSDAPFAAYWIVINPWSEVEFSIPPRVAGT